MVCVHNELQVSWGDGGPREALCQRTYSIQGTPFKCGSIGVVAVTLLLAGTFALVVLGSTIHSFNFQFQGLIGPILKDQVRVEYACACVGVVFEHARARE